MNSSAGLKSIAVRFPPAIRTNEYWRRKYPEIVADAERRSLAKLWSASEAKTVFEQEMAPYLSDPFRGTQQRRIAEPGEPARVYELAAARDALAAAKMTPSDVDLLISVALWPDQIGVGNAVWLAKELGLNCGAWNMESACSGALLAIQTACSLVAAGQHRNVLIVVSCLYSRHVEPMDTLSWFLGDGAGAVVVGPTPRGVGLLGSKTVHTAATCRGFLMDVVPAVGGGQKVRLRLDKHGSEALKEVSDGYLRRCCFGAVEAAGLSMKDIDFFVFNTPTAWFSAFGARMLGVDRSRTVDAYPLYANIGPALTTANLHLAASSGRIAAGDRVLIYTAGTISSCCAVVMKWGQVALGSRV